jgi:Cu(I)/Ag(I) efflux system membrane protein CusA/SilA
MMTVTAIMAGLVPILWSQGTGADVMKRIAAPMVGGMITSTVLTLLVIPAIYSLWREREVVQLQRRVSRTEESENIAASRRTESLTRRILPTQPAISRGEP